MRGLFLNGDGLSVRVKFHDAEALRIIHIIAEYRSSLLLGRCRLQALVQTLAVENIVSQNHGYGVRADKISADNKGLCPSRQDWAAPHRTD